MLLCLVSRFCSMHFLCHDCCCRPCRCCKAAWYKLAYSPDQSVNSYCTWHRHSSGSLADSHSSLSKSSSTSSINSLDAASSNGGVASSAAMKRTQKWVNMQQIDGAQVVRRDRRIVSAKWSALHSMLDEATTMFPPIDSDFAAADVAGYELEIILDDGNEQWYAIFSYERNSC